jgi:RNA polymerase sigma-70 factor (ECF subfamily)
MTDASRTELEAEVRRACAAGDHAAAATMALQIYGPELFGFLVTIHPSEADASDVFAETSEGLWLSLAAFSWDCSLRTWMYAIARNVMRMRSRSAARRRRRGAIVGDSALDKVAQAVRTETLAFLRTETRSRLQALRDTLPEEDRMLLVLRIDRKLAWNELARVLAESEGEEPPTEARLKRESARLRKQFQVVKERLRAMAKKEGLIA